MNENSAGSHPEKTPSAPPQPLRQRLLESWHGLTASQRRRLVGCCVYGIILTLAFIQPLASLMIYSSGTELHSHIVLIPLISAYLIGIKRGQLPMNYVTSPGWGLAMAAAGAAFLGGVWHFHHATPALSVNDRHVLPALAYVSLLAAGGFVFLGRKWMSAAAFPVCFLLLMAPLPDQVVDVLETASQTASAEAADWYFNLAGVPHLRHGKVFDLPGITIEVAQECSGIRSSWVLLITSLVAAHLFLQSAWRRTIFVLLVIPLGILRNGFRILVIGWLCVEKGPHMIDHAIHHRGGPIFFALSLIPLFLLLWWLRRGERRAEAKINRAMEPAGSAA